MSTPWVEVEKAARSLLESIVFLRNHDGTISEDEEYRLNCMDGTVSAFEDWIKEHKR